MAGDQAQFYQLLNTLSTENDIRRSQAEDAYNNILTETKIVHLVGAIKCAELGERIRQNAKAVLEKEFVKYIVPVLKTYYVRDMQFAAADILPNLLKCARNKGPQYIQRMWAYIIILPDLLKAIDSKPEQDVQVELLNSLAKCIELLGAGCLNEESMAEVLRLLNKLLSEHFERATEGYDLYYSMAKVVHSLMSAYHDTLYPQLDVLLPALLTPGRPYADRQYAISIFNELIEFGGQTCVRYKDIFLEPMLTSVRDPEPAVREAAAYGCGVLAQFGGEQFAGACAQAVPLLAATINEPDSRSDEKVKATNNAISAIAKIIKYNHSQIDRDEIIRHWLTWLPVVRNVEQAPDVYSLLCELVASGHPALATPDSPPRILATIAEAFLLCGSGDHRSRKQTNNIQTTDNPLHAQMVALVRQILTTDITSQLSDVHLD